MVEEVFCIIHQTLCYITSFSRMNSHLLRRVLLLFFRISPYSVNARYLASDWRAQEASILGSPCIILTHLYSRYPLHFLPSLLNHRSLASKYISLFTCCVYPSLVRLCHHVEQRQVRRRKYLRNAKLQPWEARFTGWDSCLSLLSDDSPSVP